MNQMSSLSSFITTNKYFISNNNIENENGDVQVNKPVAINDVVAFRNNDCKPLSNLP